MPGRDPLASLSDLGERVVPGDPATDHLVPSHLARYRFARSVLPRGARVLDLGCGVGYGTAELAPAAGIVVGIDRSVPALSHARTHHGRPNVHYVAMDLLAIAFPPESFDAAVCLEVVEHLREPEDLLRVLAKTLRREGIFVLSTPNDRTERTLPPESRSRYHVRHFDERSLAKLLAPWFGEVAIYGQRRRGSPLYAALRFLDVFNLRHVLVPRRLRRWPGTREGEGSCSLPLPAASSPVGPGCTGEEFVFDRRQLRQAQTLVAVCQTPR